MLITQDDLQRIGDEDTLLHFLEEKMNLPIPEGATLAQIALPLPLPFLGLDESMDDQIIDCHEFRGLPDDTLGGQKPFLIRFRSEQNYSEILRKIAEGLSERFINPTEIFFICANENFQPFTFAQFSDSGTKDWNAEVLNIFIWTQSNTRIHTGFEHNLSVLFSSEESPQAPYDNPENENTLVGHRCDLNSSKDLLIKLQNTGTRLGGHTDIVTGVPLASKDAFVVDESTCDQLIDKDPNSVDLIERFPDMPEKWRWELRNVIYIPSSRDKRWPWSGISDKSEAERIFKETYPAISAHMNFHKDELQREANPAVFYWEFPRCGALPKLGQPKIIYRTSSISMQAAYDTSHQFHTTSTHSIPTTDLSLLAILNSKLFNWYAYKKYNKFPKYKPLAFSKQNMKNAPIAARTDKQKEELSDLVQKILDAPDSPKAPDIEREIDELVYELYELTPAEIALIEEETNP